MHIDAIKPVWRNDLKAEWFDLIDPTFLKLMHPLDVEDAAIGRGLGDPARLPPLQPVSQDAEQRELDVKDPRRTEFGPYQFITDKVLTKLNVPELRLFGVDHIAVAWLDQGPGMDHREGEPEQ